MDINENSSPEKKGNSLNIDHDNQQLLESSPGLNLDESDQNQDSSNSMNLDIDQQSKGTGSFNEGLSLEDQQDISSLDQDLDNFIDEVDKEDLSDDFSNNELEPEKQSEENGLNIEESDSDYESNPLSNLDISDSDLNPKSDNDLNPEDENEILSSNDNDLEIDGDSDSLNNEESKDLNIEGQDSSSLKNLEEDEKVFQSFLTQMIYRWLKEVIKAPSQVKMI